MIVTRGGDDVVLGLGGKDRICTGRGFDVVLAGGGRDRIKGGRGADLLGGGRGRDLIKGGAGDDEAFGGAGNDRIQLGRGFFQFALGGRGNDTIIGGSSFDIVGYFDASGPVNVDLAAGTASGRGIDTLQNIDGVVGGPGDDTLVGTSGSNFLFGEGGNDTINTGGNGGSLDSPDTVENFLFDFVGGDTMFDTLPPGNDTITGGAGVNVVTYEESEAPIDADLAAGTVTGDGNDVLDNIQGVLGTEFDDTLVGSGADEGFDGRGGNDSIDGAGGTDALILFDFADSLVNLANGSATGDAIWFTDTGPRAVPAAYSLTGIEDVWGSFESEDDITGDDGTNRLFGLGGDDTIAGLGGDDFLDGGDGTDALDGGDGNDTCLNGESVPNCENTVARVTARGSFSGARLFGTVRSALASLRTR